MAEDPFIQCRAYRAVDVLLGRSGAYHVLAEVGRPWGVAARAVYFTHDSSPQFRSERPLLNREGFRFRFRARRISLTFIGSVQIWIRSCKLGLPPGCKLGLPPVQAGLAPKFVVHQPVLLARFNARGAEASFALEVSECLELSDVLLDSLSRVTEAFGERLLAWPAPPVAVGVRGKQCQHSEGCR